MLRKLGVLAVSAVLGLVLSACGSSTVWAGGALDEGTAASLAPMAVSNFETTGQLFSGGGMAPIPMAGAAMLAQARLQPQGPMACSGGGTITSGETADGATFTAFDECVESDGSGGSMLLHGTLYEKSGSGAYDSHVWTDPALEMEFYEADTLTLGIYMDFDILLAEQPDGGFNIDYVFSLEFDDGSDQFSMSFDMLYSYTPDSGVESPMDAGTIVYSGDMTFSEGGTPPTEYDLSMATAPSLHQSNGCIDSGAATYTDDGDNVLKIVANGCDNYTAYYNGEVITAAATSALSAALR